MKITYLAAASMLAMSLPSMGTAQSSGAAWRDTAKSVVRIVVKQRDGKFATGTGFVIAGEYIATADHVIENASEIKIIRTGLDEALQAEPIAEEPWQDLAILRVPGLKLPALKLYTGEAEATAQTEAVATVGFPGESDRYDRKLSTSPSIQPGAIQRIVRGSYNNGSGVPFSIIEFGPTLGPGYSGGPVLDQCGRVIGVAIKSDLTSVMTAEGLQRVQGDQPTSRATNSVELGELTRRQNLGTVVETTACGETSAPLAPTGQLSTAPAFVPPPAPTPETKPNYVEWGLGGLVALLLGGGLVYFTLGRNRSRPAARPEVEPVVRPNSGTQVIATGGGKTEVIGKSLELIGRSSDAYGKKILISSTDFSLDRFMVDLYRDQAGPSRTLLDERPISNPHARFTYDTNVEKIYVEDLKSSNGTILNGRPITTSREELKTGDIITFAKSYEFEVKIRSFND